MIIINPYIFSGIGANQLLWDEIVSLMDWVHSPIQTSGGEGGVYEDNTLTTLATDGAVVLGAKGIGNTLPNVPDLFSDTANNAVTPWLFYYNEGGVGRYTEKEDDKFFEIVNGSAYRIQTDTSYGVNGSISPAFGSGAFHQIVCQRAFPGALNETNAFWKHKNSAGNEMIYTQTTPDVESVSAIEYFKPQLWEFIHDGVDSWEIWLNGVLDASGSSVTMNTFTEHWIGSNGHPDAIHFYFGGYVSPSISATDIATIRANAATLFPDALPNFPCYDLVHVSGSNQYLRDTDTGSPHTWSQFTDRSRGDNIKVLNFTGGNGVEGIPLYKWLFTDTSDGRIPSNNKYDAHMDIHQGRVVTAGSSGSIDGITDDGVQIMSGSESFVDTLANLAIAIAANITAHTTAHAAVALGDEVVIFYGTGTIVSSTTTLTSTDFSFTGDGNGRFLDRDHFEDGNGRGNPTLFGVNSWVGSTTWVRQIVTPRDSEGNLGIPIEGIWMFNNIQ